MDFTTTLLQWYEKNKRDLPWRENKDPYRIWISEIMLQQTRVGTVIPYFERFMKAFPSIPDLAAAPDELLMKCWQGLGYYSRAANLKKTAKIITEQYGGKFPRRPYEIKALPGIGPYTAGAVASIAFDEKEPAVDGNVLRIFSRIFLNFGDIGSGPIKKEITQQVIQSLPQRRSGDFNQALMDLGATICLPSRPLCGQCPVHDFCRAGKEGRPHELPIKKPKKKREIKEYTVLLIESGDRIAIEKRPDQGILKNLWQFPLIEGTVESPYYVEDLMEDMGVFPRAVEEGPKAKHIFSHQEWLMSSYIITLEDAGENWTWATRTEIKDRYSIPSAFSKYLEYIEKK